MSGVDIICSEKRTFFRERSSRNRSCPRTNVEAIVFIIFQISFATRAVWKIGEYLTNIFTSVSVASGDY